MKRTLLIVLACIIIPAITWAQIPSDDLFVKYNKKEGVEVTVLAGSLIQPYAEGMSSSLTGKEKELAEKFIKNVTSVGVIQAMEQNQQQKDLKEDIAKLLKDSKYSELMTVNQDDVTVKLMTIKEGAAYKEILASVNLNKGVQVILVSIQGTFTEDVVKEAMAMAKSNM